MSKFVRSSIFVMALLAFLAAACAPAPAPTEAPAAPTEAPAPAAAPTEDPLGMYAPDAVSGDVVTAGSSTVFPLSERMAQRFGEEGFGGKITVDFIGSGAGFERFCKAGETDVANASRKIKDTEVEFLQGDRP